LKTEQLSNYILPYNSFRTLAILLFLGSYHAVLCQEIQGLRTLSLVHLLAHTDTEM